MSTIEGGAPRATGIFCNWFLGQISERDATARRWTAPLLARRVATSRSAFTFRFTRRVGRPPIDYLTRWRMVLAQQKLALGESVASTAEAAGYSSQSAFTQAYKRTMGRTPRAAE